MKSTNWSVIRKGTGRFYPRLKTNTYEGWPEKMPLNGYATLEEAKAVLIKKKQQYDEEAKLREEVEVFVL